MRTPRHHHSRRQAASFAVAVPAALGVALAGTAAATSPDHDVASSPQDRVNALLDPIIGDNYSIYSGSGFHDHGSAYVAFTGPLPAADRATILSHGHITLIEDAALDADTADALSAELFSAAVAASADGATVSLHVNPIDGHAELVSSAPLRGDVPTAPPGVTVTLAVDPSLSATADVAWSDGVGNEIDALHALNAAFEDR